MGDDDEPNDGVVFEDLYRAQLFAAIHAQPDVLLGALVSVADSSGVEMTITLLLGGLAVSGTLVSEAKWLDEVAADFERAGEGGAGFAMAFRSAAADSQLSKIAETANLELGGLSPMPTTLRAHLLRAVVHGAKGSHGTCGPVRIRLSDVAGWHLGEWRAA